MQRGLIALRKERLNLNTVLEHSIESASAIVGAHGHHVDVSCTPEPMFIDADATRIEQVLVNLLSNAAKYTPRGGQIRIATANENGRAVIRVRDTGIGIAPELLPRIFELFTQGNRSLDRADGGLGIGLTLVRHLVEMHGGTISAHSEGPGKGSEFVVNLPLSETKAAPEKPASRRRHPTGALAFRKVLIVEDNDDSRDTLQTILELWGHKTLVARNGVEGLELALHEQPEIGLIDVGLPGMNGYELAKGIRSGLGKSMFLVALTGYGQPEDRKRAFESGFDSHLVKPADLDELARIIGAAPSVGAHT
jgi:CheY-like chemotaxis protein